MSAGDITTISINTEANGLSYAPATYTQSWNKFTKVVAKGGGMMQALTITNSEASGYTNIQLAIRFTKNNWNWATSLSDGSDLRFFAADKTTALSFWIATWDSTAKAGVVVVKVPSVPTGTSTIYASGGNASSALSSYDNTMQRNQVDAGLLAQIRFDEGSGSTLSSSVGSWPGGTMNGTWSAGDGGRFGLDAMVAPRFSTGSKGVFDGTTATISQIPDLLAAVIPAVCTVPFWWKPTGATNNSGVIIGSHRYGTIGWELHYVSMDRLGLYINGGSGITADSIQGYLGDGNTEGHKLCHIALGWGGTLGAWLMIDGVMQSSNPLFTSIPPVLPSGVGLGRGEARGLSVGGHYDPRLSECSNPVAGEIDDLEIYNRQLTKNEVDQIRYRVKIHTITTAGSRFAAATPTIALNGSTVGHSYNEDQWEEFDTLDGVVGYSRAAGGITANGVISRVTSSDSGLTFGSDSRVMGLTYGGYANSVYCPSIFRDPASGTYYLYFAGNLGGNKFQDLHYATSPDGITFTHQGILYDSTATGNAVGNSKVIYAGGKYHLYLEIGFANGWNVIHGVGTTPTAFTFGGAVINLGHSYRAESSGPHLTQLSDGSFLILLHSEYGGISVTYCRRAVDLDAPVWGFYDDVRGIIQGELGTWYPSIADPSNANITQVADPTVIQVGGNTLLYYDIRAGNTAGAIGVTSVAGTIDAVFTESVRADLPVAASGGDDFGGGFSFGLEI